MNIERTLSDLAWDVARELSPSGIDSAEPPEARSAYPRLVEAARTLRREDALAEAEDAAHRLIDAALRMRAVADGLEARDDAFRPDLDEPGWTPWPEGLVDPFADREGSTDDD